MIYYILSIYPQVQKVQDLHTRQTADASKASLDAKEY